MTAPEATATAPPQPALWHNRAYLLLMSGKTTQIIGSGVSLFAAPLIVYALTGSTVIAGVITGIGAAGALLATLPAGVIADRVDRRRLLILCSVIGAVLWGSVAVAALAGHLTIGHLAVVLFGGQVIGSVYAPAESAAIRQVVRSEQMGSAMAAMEGRGAVASLVSSPLGGVLYGFGKAWPLLADFVGYLVALACAWLVREPLNPPRTAPPAGMWASLRDGLRFVWAVPLLRFGLVIFMLLNLAFSGILFVLNLHLISIGTAPVLIGLIDAVAGASMLAGSLFAGRLITRFRTGPLAIVGLCVTTLGGVGLALSDRYWEYLVALAVAGLLLPAVNSGLMGYVAAITPHEMQGRMNAALSLSYLAVAPFAPVLSGWLLAVAPSRVGMAVFAALLLLSVIALVAFPPVRRIGRADEWAADEVRWPPA